MIFIEREQINFVGKEKVMIPDVICDFAGFSQRN